MGHDKARYILKNRTNIDNNEEVMKKEKCWGMLIL